MRPPAATAPLVRLLGPWFPATADAAGMDFAERLGLWLNAFDAIRLQQGQQDIRALAAPARLAPVKAQPLQEDLRKVRSVLAAAIARDPMAQAQPEEGFAPYRERHLELQRQMDLMIPPLREHVRDVLGRASPRLRQLAALDAVWQEVLAARVQQQLAGVPALLLRRFIALRDTQALERFGAEWRQAVLAELELRLAPVTGLVEAAGKESDT